MSIRKKARNGPNGPIARTVRELKIILSQLSDESIVITEFGSPVEVIHFVGEMGNGVQFREYREDEE